MDGEAGLPCPIHFEFKRLRRSGRLESQTKRTYEAMQGTNNRTGTRVKKPKLAADKCVTDSPATNGTCKEPATDKFATSEPPTSEPPTSEPPTSEPTINRAAINNPNTIEALEHPGADEALPPTSDIHIPIEGGETTSASPEGMSQSTSDTGSPETGSMSTNPTSYPPSETHDINSNLPNAVQCAPFVKRSILDESAQLLHHVLMALDKADDTSRRPNSSVPGVLDDVLTKTDFTLFVKIMTSIIENLVKHNHRIAKPAWDVVQERSREVEWNKVGPYLRTESNYRLPNQFRKTLSNGERRHEEEIARLDMRELAERELQKLLSEPTELIGEFREESDYENAIKHVEKENADDTRTRLRRLWKETYYWPMIQQRAKMIGPLPKSSGPKTEITPQEKLAAKKLILAMGYGQSRDNIFKWMSYLKLLSDLRDKGATALLLYRTGEFKTYFFQHPKDLDILLSWNQVYDFSLRQLRLRVIAEEGNDFSGKSDVEEKWISDRLHAPQKRCWGNHLSVWDQDLTEYENFLANHSMKPTSGKSNIHVLRHGIKGQLDRNKSIYVGLVPYNGESGKMAFKNKTASTELLLVASLVPVAPGDFLGIFPGQLRYTEQKPTRAIKGPVPGLWLDYSEVMGKLNKMKVAKAGEMTNVCLAWEGVNEVKGDKSFCQYLRVLVIATRHIMPFDQLIRPPSGAGVL
jgi:hypothetical protein